MDRPSRPCRKAGCGALSRDRSGYCEEHASLRTGWNQNPHRGTRQQRGYGAKWEKIRKRAMKRDAWLCQPCLQSGRHTPATEVDHITPKARGGTDEIANLQAICRECHKAKTASDRGQAMP